MSDRNESSTDDTTLLRAAIGGAHALCANESECSFDGEGMVYFVIFKSCDDWYIRAMWQALDKPCMPGDAYRVVGLTRTITISPRKIRSRFDSETNQSSETISAEYVKDYVDRELSKLKNLSVIW